MTELCPWPSLVQRLGRVNRRGERSQAEVRIHGPFADEALDKLEDRPYPASELDAWAVLHRADLLQLFDTTPSLEGDWTSVAQWVRDVEQVGVWVGWRAGAPAEQDESELTRDELCPVSLAEARRYAKDRPLWSRGRVDASWTRVRGRDIRPGMVLRADAKEGGYTVESGWSLGARATVPPVEDAS